MTKDELVNKLEKEIIVLTEMIEIHKKNETSSKEYILQKNITSSILKDVKKLNDNSDPQGN